MHAFVSIVITSGTAIDDSADSDDVCRAALFFRKQIPLLKIAGAVAVVARGIRRGQPRSALLDVARSAGQELEHQNLDLVALLQRRELMRVLQRVVCKNESQSGRVIGNTSMSAKVHAVRLQHTGDSRTRSASAQVCQSSRRRPPCLDSADGPHAGGPCRRSS